MIIFFLVQDESFVSKPRIADMNKLTANYSLFKKNICNADAMLTLVNHGGGLIEQKYTSSFKTEVGRQSPLQFQLQ